MTLLAMPTVELFFDLAGLGGGGSFFTIQSATLGTVQGTAVLAGNLATDVSAYVLDCSVTRGRSRQFDEVQAGTATITLRNDDRRFDPLNTSSPYNGNILPGKKVQITKSGVYIYAGTIDDWNFGYDLNGLSIATITCVDGLAAISAIEMFAWTGTTGQRAGARISAVLDRFEVNYPPSRAIDTGASTLQADTITDGTNVLAYLQLINDGELGHLFASRPNVLTFQARNTNANSTATAFADTTAGIRFNRIEVSYGTELLFNTTIVARVGGTTETFTDTGSAAAYGVRTLSKTGLLYDTDQQSSDLGDYLVAIYGEPELRVSTLGVTMARLSTSEQAALLALELGSVVSVTFTPDGLGSAIVREALVEGIQHDIRREEWDVALSLGDATSRFVFTIQDSAYGIIQGPGLIAF